MAIKLMLMNATSIAGQLRRAVVPAWVYERRARYESLHEEQIRSGLGYVEFALTPLIPLTNPTSVIQVAYTRLKSRVHNWLGEWLSPSHGVHANGAKATEIECRPPSKAPYWFLSNEMKYYYAYFIPRDFELDTARTTVEAIIELLRNVVGLTSEVSSQSSGEFLLSIIRHTSPYCQQYKGSSTPTNIKGISVPYDAQFEKSYAPDELFSDADAWQITSDIIAPFCREDIHKIHGFVSRMDRSSRVYVASAATPPLLSLPLALRKRGLI